MPLFRNYYRCARCKHEWTDEWSAMCDDDCPQCGARHMSPYRSEDIEPEDANSDLVDRAQEQRTVRIRGLNDSLRRTITGGRVVLTAGVAALSEQRRDVVLKAVQNFDDNAFDKANDPYGEHDFIAFDIEGQSYFAKIDYYDVDLKFGSEDPADPSKTARALTIMRADEY